MKAACHCGAVRFEIARPPEWVLDCSCTLCRRYGALWSYYHRGDGPAQLLRTPDPATTDTYVWGDKALATHRCKVCGCVTHLALIEPPQIYAVNARIMVTLDPATVRLVQVDNSHTGWFWTREPDERWKSEHPPMPLPGPDDWR